MFLSIEDISRSIHSLNLNILDSKRIAKEQAEIAYKQKIREFHKIEIDLYQKFDNADIMTYDELAAQINAAYQKIVCEVDLK